MVPIPLASRYSRVPRLLYLIVSLASQHAPRFLRHGADSEHPSLYLAKRTEKFNPHEPKSIVFAILIPVLVLMSGLFAGLTLGYMSLDETQLNVLSISGTPKQKEYANKIKPIRKNGHLLLVTLLLANMITNETLPVIADPVLGGGVQSVVVSTVLIVIFAEIIPQSLFTRHGLYLGAKMAGFTKFLIYAMGVIAWPVAKLLELVLGSHHGIIYRRAELKELIAMHSSQATLGGDLKLDTVTIIGATLDLQEKVVRQAMTPISDVFMLSIESKLDYDLLKKICQTGHSRIPVYEEVDVPISIASPGTPTGTLTPKGTKAQPQRMQKVKKIVGILLVKQCVLLDPKDATPLRTIRLNKVPFVPNNEPLLGILDKFQEGRSHMAIVSRFSKDKAASVKKAVKRGLAQRFRERVGIGESESDSDSDEDKSTKKHTKSKGDKTSDEEETEMEIVTHQGEVSFSEPEKPPGQKSSSNGEEGKKSGRTGFQLAKAAANVTSMSMLEQSMPADAVLAKAGAEEFLQGFDPAVMPLGIITLEDVLEELIGEEIYDEFDPQGAHGDPYEAPLARVPPPNPTKPSTSPTLLPLMPNALKGLDFLRSRSAPPVPRDGEAPNSGNVEELFGRGRNPAVVDYGHPTTPNPPQPKIEMPRPIRNHTLQHPVIANQGTANVPIGQSPQASEIAKNKPNSRSASPAPPLEAVLLDRKRRLAGLHTSGGDPAKVAQPVIAKEVASASPSPRIVGTTKGARFKSSPLGSGDAPGGTAGNIEAVKEEVADGDHLKEGE